MAGTSTGSAKRVAALAGITLDEFSAFQAKGIHWCVGCKAFHPREDFGRDGTFPDGRARTCRFFRNRRSRQRYVPAENPRFGPLPNPPRDGDKKQARQRINVLVRTGRFPHPNSLPCIDCWHEYSAEGQHRHEYDHHLGYAAEHHLDVQVVCTLCHFRRGVERGEIPSDPRNAAHRRRKEVVASG